MTRDALRFPAAVQFALRLQAGVLANIVQQPIRIEAEQIVGVTLHGLLERTVEQLDFAERKGLHSGLLRRHRGTARNHQRSENQSSQQSHIVLLAGSVLMPAW